MHTATDSRSGYSLLEVTIGFAMMAGVLFVAANGLKGGSAMSEVVTAKSKMTDDAQRVIHEIATELRSADTNWIFALDATAPGLYRLSYQVCTGFDATTGAPVYDEGDYKHYVEWDTNRRTLVKIVDDDDTLSNGWVSERTLTENVSPEVDAGGTPIGFTVQKFPEGTSTVENNRMILTLRLQWENSDGELVEQEASRTVFLRSSFYGSDGLDGSSDSTTVDDSGTYQGDLAGEETTLTSQPPADISDPGGPNIIWGQDQGAGTAFMVLITLETTKGGKLDNSQFDIQFWGDNAASMTVTKGWDPGVNSPKDNEVLVQGTVTSSLGITVKAVSVRNGVYSTTQKTNWY